MLKKIRKNVTIRMSDRTRALAEKLAMLDGRTMTRLLEWLINEEAKKRKVDVDVEDEVVDTRKRGSDAD